MDDKRIAVTKELERCVQALNDAMSACSEQRVTPRLQVTGKTIIVVTVEWYVGGIVSTKEIVK